MIKKDTPILDNRSYYFNEQHSPFDEKADAMRQKILDYPDTIKPHGETRYISYKGDDSNDGKTPETAWKTQKNLIENSFDTVLFERGGVYRGGFELFSETSYGAFGDGPKPCFYGCDRNYAQPGTFEAYSENIWRAKVPTGLRNIGNVIFDHGKIVGNKSIDGVESLKEDYWFWHDLDNDYVYLYFSKGKPDEVFEDIEFPSVEYWIRGKEVGVHHVIVENFCVKYYGAHGLSFATSSDNIILRGCEIGYIGGSMQEYYCPGPVRYGNGIEFVNSYTNITVEDCWVYQCHDAGISHQNCGNNYMPEDNIVFRNNLVEYCNYNIEMFSRPCEKAMLNNVVYEGNFLRFAGFGWGSLNRINSDNMFASNINGWRRITPNKDFYIRNNIFDVSFRQHLSYGYPNTEYGPVIEGNTYIGRKGIASSVLYTLPEDGNPENMVSIGLGDKNLEEFTKSVKSVDKNPKEIIFLEEEIVNDLTDKLSEGGRVNRPDPLIRYK